MFNELQDLLGLQADTIADVPLVVPFVINDRSMLPKEFPISKTETEEELKRFSLPWIRAKITRKKTVKKEYRTEIIIEPQKTGTVMRLHPLITKIDQEDLEKISVNQDRPFDEAAPGIMAKYHDVIVEAICIGIYNRKGPFPEYMPEFLRENCTWKDLHYFLNAILFRMGTLSFINSTTLLTKMGPGAEEIIALQKNLESHGKERLMTG